MKITILGSGTTVPTKQRYPSSYLIEHNDTRILMDCGHLAIARLLAQDINLQSIESVAITHFHPDHLSHFLPFVHARFVDDLYEKREHKSLTVYAPEGMQERWRKLREVFWVEPGEDYPLMFKEGSANDKLGDLSLRSFPIRHVEWFASVGYRLEAGGKIIAYTGDLGPEQSEETLESLANADLLIIEAAATQPSATHLTAQQAVELGKQVSAKQIVLTHLRDSIIGLAQLEVDKEPELVTLAEDGMTFDL